MIWSVTKNIYLSLDSGKLAINLPSIASTIIQSLLPYGISRHFSSELILNSEKKEANLLDN